MEGNSYKIEIIFNQGQLFFLSRNAVVLPPVDANTENDYCDPHEGCVVEVALDPTQGLAQGKEEDDPDQDNGHLANDIPGCRTGHLIIVRSTCTNISGLTVLSHFNF